MAHNGLSRSMPIASRVRSREYLSASPLVRASIARDLEEDTDSDDEAAESESDADSETGVPIPSYEDHPVDMASSYRHGSFANAGTRGTYLFDTYGSERAPYRAERHQAWREERSLLRDNNVIPAKHPQEGDAADTFGNRLRRRVSKAGFGIPGGDRPVARAGEETGSPAGGAVDASEETPLLGDPEQPYGGQDDPETMQKTWEEAVAAGMIHTTWQRETKVILSYTAPLVPTFILSYSLLLSSMLAVGHLGAVELGAISIAAMSAQISGYAFYQGLATALDTLCAQAYGSGKRKLVGLQLQRMVLFLWVCTIPIAVLWLCSPWILAALVPEPEVAELAGQYLRIAVIGMPAYSAFEGGKRYLQAQGIFSASLYILMVVAPLNAFMNWLFIWHLKWGFIGAPIAVVINNWLLLFGLVGYTYFFVGTDCWPGLTKRALHNWGPLIRLALPGLLMVEAEVLAFEILTLASSHLGTTALAAQSVLASTASLTWQIPFPLSIATSTRIANLIGATLADAAKTTAKVGFVLATIVGLFNFTIISALKDWVPRLFSSDERVWAMASDVLPLCAAFQLFDALAANCNGILRGLGRQEVGGYVQLACYYIVAIPISMAAAFPGGWGLHGLWTGVAIALGLVAAIETVFISRASWQRSVDDARRRNEAA